MEPKSIFVRVILHGLYMYVFCCGPVPIMINVPYLCNLILHFDTILHLRFSTVQHIVCNTRVTYSAPVPLSIVTNLIGSPFDIIYRYLPYLRTYNYTTYLPMDIPGYVPLLWCTSTRQCDRKNKMIIRFPCILQIVWQREERGVRKLKSSKKVSISTHLSEFCHQFSYAKKYLPDRQSSGVADPCYFDPDPCHFHPDPLSYWSGSD